MHVNMNRRCFMTHAGVCGAAVAMGVGTPLRVAGASHAEEVQDRPNDNGIALTIGLNSVDPAHYAGWSGPLNACEFDANDIATIAKSRKFKTDTLLTKHATRQAVLDLITKAAKDLGSGDFFLLSYSGHGGQIQDTTGDEIFGSDQTWCLYDGQLLDDELWLSWAQFKPGVRILVFSDSCHSGTVTKEREYVAAVAAGFGGRDYAWPTRGWPGSGFALAIGEPSGMGMIHHELSRLFRAMPLAIAAQVYRKNLAFYKSLEEKVKDGEKAIVKATVLLISGCQDNQLSADGIANGLFTSKLKITWRDGAFVGDYHDFHATILAQMPPTQSPNYYVVGAPNALFESQHPFTI